MRDNNIFLPPLSVLSIYTVSSSGEATLFYHVFIPVVTNLSGRCATSSAMALPPVLLSSLPPKTYLIYVLRRWHGGSEQRQNAAGSEVSPQSLQIYMVSEDPKTWIWWGRITREGLTWLLVVAPDTSSHSSMVLPLCSSKPEAQDSCWLHPGVSIYCMLRVCMPQNSSCLFTCDMHAVGWPP